MNHCAKACGHISSVRKLCTFLPIFIDIIQINAKILSLSSALFLLVKIMVVSSQPLTFRAELELDTIQVKIYNAIK